MLCVGQISFKCRFMRIKSLNSLGFIRSRRGVRYPCFFFAPLNWTMTENPSGVSATVSLSRACCCTAISRSPSKMLLAGLHGVRFMGALSLDVVMSGTLFLEGPGSALKLALGHFLAIGFVAVQALAGTRQPLYPLGDRAAGRAGMPVR